MTLIFECIVFWARAIPGQFAQDPRHRRRESDRVPKAFPIPLKCRTHLFFALRTTRNHALMLYEVDTGIHDGEEEFLAGESI
jgi:hypothetical protein